MINKPENIDNCVAMYSFQGKTLAVGAIDKMNRFVSILENNVYVMIFTLIFSIIFGAGAVFVLAWNASVIAAAISIFASNKISGIPLGIGRYMLHGFPEIAAYFVTALAGGIFGVGILRNGLKNKKFFKVMQNVIILLFIAILMLILAALIEVYISPKLGF